EVDRIVLSVPLGSRERPVDRVAEHGEQLVEGDAQAARGVAASGTHAIVARFGGGVGLGRGARAGLLVGILVGALDQRDQHIVRDPLAGVYAGTHAFVVTGERFLAD